MKQGNLYKGAYQGETGHKKGSYKREMWHEGADG